MRFMGEPKCARRPSRSAEEVDIFLVGILQNNTNTLTVVLCTDDVFI